MNEKLIAVFNRQLPDWQMNAISYDIYIQIAYITSSLCLKLDDFPKVFIVSHHVLHVFIFFFLCHWPFLRCIMVYPPSRPGPRSGSLTSSSSSCGPKDRRAFHWSMPTCGSCAPGHGDIGKVETMNLQYDI